MEWVSSCSISKFFNMIVPSLGNKIKLVLLLILNSIKNYSYNHLLDYYSRCRWSTNPGEPLLFIKYDWNQLTILDAEKKALTIKRPIQMDSSKSDKTCFLSILH